MTMVKVTINLFTIIQSMQPIRLHYSCILDSLTRDLLNLTVGIRKLAIHSYIITITFYKVRIACFKVCAPSK